MVVLYDDVSVHLLMAVVEEKVNDVFDLLVLMMRKMMRKSVVQQIFI
jgi:hypothetical protein